MIRWPRRIHVLAANLIALVLVRALKGWGRNLVSIAPALGSMTILLAISGVAGIAAIAAAATLAEQTEQAYVLHVYIGEQASSDQVDALRMALAADPRVRGVTVVSPAETLRRELRRPGVAGLVDAAGDNPFPGSLDVSLASPSSIGAVAGWVGVDPAVDPLYPTSYDPGTYARMRTLVSRSAAVGTAVLGVLALISVAVTANAVRAAVVARRDEVRIMRLVGAPWWAVRLPFLVEGGLTGTAAGLIAAAALLGVAATVTKASASMFTDLLPGVTMTRLTWLLAGLVAGGALLGASSGALALRRLPR